MAMPKKVVGSTDPRGASLVEVVFGIMVLIPCFLLLLEMFRRELFDLSIQHIACATARKKALGKKETTIEQSMKETLVSRLGRGLGTTIYDSIKSKNYRVADMEYLKWLKLGHKPGVVSELHLRYPQFYQFRTNRGFKHHQELIRRCLFPVL